eukprot:TRINITY_DN20714_c0_g1_i1.p1 TRINITY_DN20714_c0_g1~~TRINITY_DN20714_c0_g1_i1.p1  ORF type:complete len:219 (-),score=18.31 TRINITY_DN20714_c0_g1_i1:97-753(-)
MKANLDTLESFLMSTTVVEDTEVTMEVDDPSSEEFFNQFYSQLFSPEVPQVLTPQVSEQPLKVNWDPNRAFLSISQTSSITINVDKNYPLSDLQIFSHCGPKMEKRFLMRFFLECEGTDGILYRRELLLDVQDLLHYEIEYLNVIENKIYLRFLIIKDKNKRFLCRELCGKFKVKGNNLPDVHLTVELVDQLNEYAISCDRILMPFRKRKPNANIGNF